jgi:hypothetical protein
MTTYCVHRAARRPWVRHVAHVRGKRNTYRVSVEKTDGKRSLGRHRHR